MISEAWACSLAVVERKTEEDSGPQVDGICCGDDGGGGGGGNDSWVRCSSGGEAPQKMRSAEDDEDEGERSKRATKHPKS